MQLKENVDYKVEMRSCGKIWEEKKINKYIKERKVNWTELSYLECNKKGDIREMKKGKDVCYR